MIGLHHTQPPQGNHDAARDNTSHLGGDGVHIFDIGCIELNDYLITTSFGDYALVVHVAPLSRRRL